MSFARLTLFSVKGTLFFGKFARWKSGICVDNCLNVFIDWLYFVALSAKI